MKDSPQRIQHETPPSRGNSSGRKRRLATRRRPVADPGLFPAAVLQSDWRVLCRDIGERRAGTGAERRAADFVQRRFHDAGAGEVRMETFPCTSLRDAVAEVHEPAGRSWRPVPAAAVVGAPGTPQGKAVTGDLVWLEMPEQAGLLKPDSLRGRIVGLFGPLPTSSLVHRRLVAARPLAVIHVDDRLPFSWTKNDGVYPYWSARYGMPPTLTVPYTEAWRWRRDGVTRLRVRAAVDLVAAESQNVIADFPGTSAGLPAVVLTAHHDTQCGNPGADDNASGVICLLALARALAGKRLTRTVRFISFGTEEQLSVGSSIYVKRHRFTNRDVGLVLNFDSVSSPLGHSFLSIAGSPRLARFASSRLSARGLHAAVVPEIMPFSDHFPFNRAGIPSVFFGRSNFPGGRWQHHSPHDTLDHVSVTEVQLLLRAVHPLLTELASSRRWPFPSTLPREQETLARRIGRELFG